MSAVPERETYPVEIEGVHRDLPLFEVAPGLRIAVFNLLGDTEVVRDHHRRHIEFRKPFAATSSPLLRAPLSHSRYWPA